MEDQPKRLYRSRHDRIIAGVCGGLGKYLDIDPLFIRLVFILLVFADGLGLLLYLILLIIMKEEPGEGLNIERGNRGEKIKEFTERVGKEAKSMASAVKTDKSWFSDRRNVIGLIIIFFGLILLINQLFPTHWFKWHLFWPILVIIFGLYFIFKSRGK